MKANLFYTLFTGMLILLALGCSKDDSSGQPGNCGDGQTWIDLVSDESSNVGVAGAAYGNDRTPANCEKYKKAYADYLKALRDISACVPEYSIQGYEQAIQAAERDLDQLCQ